VLTAVFAGLLVLAGALWAGDQLQAVRLPTPTWSIEYKAKGGVFSEGQTVQLIDIRGDKPQTLGSAVVARVERDTQLVLGTIALDSKSASVLDAGRIVSPSGLIADVSGQRGIPIFDPRYLSLGVGSLIVIVGVGLIYWHVGRRPRSVDFLIAVDGEMKRVNWSTRQTIIDSTMVVIGATFLIAAVLFAADWFLQWVYAISGVVRY
jgi:preprotein translocase SecE subunit